MTGTDKGGKRADMGGETTHRVLNAPDLVPESSLSVLGRLEWGGGVP